MSKHNREITNQNILGLKIAMKGLDIQPQLSELIEELSDWVELPIMYHAGFALWRAKEHAKFSWHYLGLAVDFHFVTTKSFSLQLAEMELFFSTCGYKQKLGFGVYPMWQNRGFHLDCRGVIDEDYIRSFLSERGLDHVIEKYIERNKKARWGQLNGLYVDYQKVKDYVQFYCR